MARFRKSNQYYFSVEGETERWYLKWLQDKINNSENSAKNVSFNCNIQKDPVKYVKKLTILGKTEVYHFSDYESNEPKHIQQFTTTMDRMKEASSIKQITYKFGYTNFTFDLWMILHMANCNGSIAHRKKYIKPLNRAYTESFENMDEFKRENNFKRCLGKLELSNVIDVTNRAKKIMRMNAENGYTLHQYKGFSYYKENPSLTIWEAIEKIMKDCELM